MKAVIQVCVEGLLARIRLVGCATFASSQVLQDFCTQALAAGVTHCRFELKECLSLDSTFIGGMVMLATPESNRGGVVEILNATEKVRRQITSLGIGGLFTFLEQPDTPGAWKDLDTPNTVPGDSGRLSRTMLDAHEMLGRANPENVDRFKYVVEELRRERQHRPPTESGQRAGEIK